MNKIGVFYGSTTGTTEDLARRIAEKLDVPSAHIYDVSKLTEALVGEYDVLVRHRCTHLWRNKFC